MVTPLFFILIFGIVEVGFAMNDNLAVAHATRAGSRVASASGNDLYADYGILQSIARESAALDSDQIERIVVYKPSGPGEAPTDACKGGTPSAASGRHVGACNVYTAADLAEAQGRLRVRPDQGPRQVLVPDHPGRRASRAAPTTSGCGWRSTTRTSPGSSAPR